MRQALVAGVSALLMAILMPGWLLPAETDTEPEPLVLIMDGPQRKVMTPMIAVKCGGQVLEIPFEEYLVGVVLSEMPASFEIEALKAQAVAARTFAMRRMDGSKHDDCDLCADSTCCQAWNSRASMADKLGQSSEIYWSKAEQAVRETAGEVLVYGGELIDAVYFSCSGGRTEAAVAVWGSEVPYLQSVSSGGEEQARVFETEVTLEPDIFQALFLEVYPNANLSGKPENWFGETMYTDGGGVQTMVIGGQLAAGTELRGLFKLNSTSFDVTITEGDICFCVRGYGHRVGMSQYGANAMAKTGCTYKEILAHYYTGTVLENR